MPIRQILGWFGLGWALPARATTMTVLEAKTGDFAQEVSGEGRRQPAIREAARAAGHRLQREEDGSFIMEVALIRESTNRHDRNAIQVCDVEQRHLGYIPRDLAEELAAPLDRLEGRRIVVTCDAKVFGKNRTYGLWLDLDIDEVLDH